jgi:hypothetical protein
MKKIIYGVLIFLVVNGLFIWFIISTTPKDTISYFEQDDDLSGLIIQNCESNCFLHPTYFYKINYQDTIYYVPETFSYPVWNGYRYIYVYSGNSIHGYFIDYGNDGYVQFITEEEVRGFVT